MFMITKSAEAMRSRRPSLVGDARLGVGAIHLAPVHEPFEGNVNRGIDDEQPRTGRSSRLPPFDKERKLEHDDAVG